MKIKPTYYNSKEFTNRRRAEKNIQELVKEYKYQCIPDNLVNTVQMFYIKHMPKRFIPRMNGILTEETSFPIYTIEGTLIARDFEWICVGDYGAYVEIDPQHAAIENMLIPHDQIYRLEDPQYKDQVKYLWYTAKDNSQIKIYHQKKTVPYAAYKPNFFYVSVYEVFNRSCFIDA